MLRILAGASALAFCLAGCTAAGPVTPSSVAQDVRLEAQSLNAMLPQLGAAAVHVPPQVAVALADLETVATTIQSAETTSAALPQVQRVEADVNTVVAALSVLPLPPPLPTVLQAASVLLPEIEMAVGIVVPVGAQLHGMSADQARIILSTGAVPVVHTPISK